MIVKRKTIDLLVEKLRDLGSSRPSPTAGPTTGAAAFRQSAADPRREDNGAAPACACSGRVAVVLAVGAVAVPIIRHRTALDALSARTAAARTEAATVRQAVEASQAASAQIAAIGRLVRARIPLARMMEELTAVLPDSAWVSDVRMDGDVVEFTGFARSAASLVAPLENSPLFMQASLTSPVVFDSSEDKERFSMRLKLNGGGGAISAEGEVEAARQRTGSMMKTSRV